MTPYQARLAALFAVCFTASAQHFHDSIELLQSTKVNCGFCRCITKQYAAKADDGMRCLLTELDHHMLRGRIFAENALSKVNWEITHACSDVQKAISGDQTQDAIIHDFMTPMTQEFEKCASRFEDVKRQYNLFADSIAGDMKQLSQDHIAVKFDTCIRHSDQDIAKFTGMLKIAEDVFRMTEDADLKIVRVMGFFETSLKFTRDFRDTSFKCFEDFSQDFFKWAVSQLPTTSEKEQSVSLQALRLGVKFTLLVLQSSEQEIRALVLEIQCLCQNLGKEVPELHSPMNDPSEESDAPPDTLPGDELKSLKSETKSVPKRRKLNDLEWLIKDLPEIKTMLDKHQINLLDEVIAMHNGTWAAKETRVES